MTSKPKKTDKPEKPEGTNPAEAATHQSSAPAAAEETAAKSPVSQAAKPADNSTKRVVLKTLKRAAAAPPPSPTLRKVTPGLVRRVVPKAPPPKPIPPPAPPPPAVPPKPAMAPASTAKSAIPPGLQGATLRPAATTAPKPAAAAAPAPAPAPTAKPATPPAPTTPAAPSKAAGASAPAAPPVKKPAEGSGAKPSVRPPAKTEPTATYKMPPPTPLKTMRPPMARPPLGTGAPAPAGASASATGTTTTAAKSAAPEAAKQKIRIPEVITVKDLAERLNVKSIDVIKKLLTLGTMVTINQQLDSDTAVLAADALGFEAEIVPILQEQSSEEKEDPAKLKPRAPIVTIMGHVDHGKTSLLDAIRKTRVAEKEAGGITQHIGAYRVPTSKGDVVFLDTPGHEAFTAMRARGAQVTDIVVLVVAADDGVMPQTVEAIDHARAAGVTIVVAVNKVDLPTADPEKIRRELTKHQLVPEEWGGKTIYVDVSAKKGTNVDKLLEMLGLESELLELKANPERPGQGVVVEARMDARRGVTATLLIQKGTLHVGDVVVAGTTYGRIRALLDDRGNRLDQAGPASPVEVLGLSAVPQAGDRFTAMPDEREARTLVERRQLALSEEAVRRRHVTLETLHESMAEGKIRDLKVILKADVQGSVQAIRDAFDRLTTGEIRMNVIHAGVGGINETDVTLAAASNAIIIGFNVRAEAKAEELARREEVDIKTYRIIYEAISDVRAAMEGLLQPETVEIALGRAEVRQVFKLSKGGTIAGSMVVDGKIVRGAKARLIRDSVVIHEGTIESLKRFKDDAREVEKGFECGIGFGSFNDVKAQDVIQAYSQETRARKLESKE